MPRGPAGALLGQIRRWIGWQPGADQSDHELLQAFVERHDTGAFEALLQRHGPMVLGTCQRVLAAEHDAEDAFQATFLVLSRKAASIRQGEALAGWLARVATRIAVSARSGLVRRQAQERQVIDMPQAEPADSTWHELRPLLDEEVDRLPHKYRVPVVLCYLEGKTHDEAARQLGWPKGTVAGRLARARDLLRKRLERRGLGLSLAGLSACLESPLQAAPSAALLDGTLHHVTLFAAGQHVAAQAASLAEGALRTMYWTKVKIAAAVLVSLAVIGVGSGLYLQQERTTAAAFVPVEDDQKVDLAKVDPAVFQTFNQAELAFTGRIANVAHGPTGLSDPPLYTMKITFDEVKMLRGQKLPDMTFSHSHRGKSPVALEAGNVMLVSARLSPNPSIAAIVPATDDGLAAARRAVTYPIGWTLDKGKVVSPWASLGDKAKLPGLEGGRTCARTGRPALLAGPNVQLTVEQVKPAKIFEFKNPYGDGEFKITVTNTSKEAVEVPALLTDGKQIFWDDSVLVFHTGKAHVLPGAGKIAAAKVQPVKLEPGASVSTTINTLRLKDVPWPRGGSRVYLQFCLGELSRTDFFYYFSNHHDPLRDKAK